jgi:hypothetical protein
LSLRYPTLNSLFFSWSPIQFSYSLILLHDLLTSNHNQSILICNLHFQQPY